MTIALPPDIEKRLQGEASRRGVGVAELAAELIAEQLPPAPVGSSLADLFARWEREDKGSDSRDLDELKAAMNRNRMEMEGPDSRKPFA